MRLVWRFSGKVKKFWDKIGGSILRSHAVRILGFWQGKDLLEEELHDDEVTPTREGYCCSNNIADTYFTLF